MGWRREGEEGASNPVTGCRGNREIKEKGKSRDGEGGGGGGGG